MNNKITNKKSDFDLDKTLLILGCGGHSKVVTDIAEEIGFKNIKYLDTIKTNSEFLGKTVFNKIEENYSSYFFVALGDNFIRETLTINFLSKNKKAELISLIHPSSFVSKNCNIEEGSIIMPGCVLNCFSKLGKGVIINSGSVIEHDSELMDFSSTGPNATLGGNVFIGKRTSISIGVNIKHGIKIGDDVVVGGGSYVTKDIEKNCLVYGVPSKFIKKRERGDKYL